MKKFLALICMITCIFGLTACGNEEALNQYEQQKVEYAKQMAAQAVVPFLAEAFEFEHISLMEYGISMLLAASIIPKAPAAPTLHRKILARYW